MKKTLVSALTTALVVGAASTTFAAANPFSDVPADHWAYDAVSQLAADGVIEGYGDTTFRGNQNITRYEMAQMIAKAMAKTDVSAADKALIDKLAAEFSDELNNLGVRVSNLERNADNVKWNGQARYRYWSDRREGRSPEKKNKDQMNLRFEPSAEVNNHWHVKSRIDAWTNPSKDKADKEGQDNFKIARLWAQGDYDNFQVKLGKMPLFSTETNGMLFDAEFSGASATVGNKLKATVEAGRWNLGDSRTYTNIHDASEDTAANYQGYILNGTAGKLYGGVAYRHFNSKGFKAIKANTDEANIWSVGAGYTFDKNWSLNGGYAKNEKADDFETAHNIQVNYKGAQKANKGTWGAYAAYRYLGKNVAFNPVYETFLNDGASNAKGWEVGAEYAPFTNVLAAINYFDGKQLENNDLSDKVLFGRVNFFF